MAEELEGGTQAATAEQPATGDASSVQGWTLDDLEDVIARTVESKLNPWWKAVDSRLGTVETLKGPVLEVLQEQKAMRPLVNKLLAGETMEPAEIEKLELAAENARLKQEKQERDNPKPQTQARTDPADDDPQAAADRLVAYQYFRGGWRDQLKDLFEEEGQDWGSDQQPSALLQKVERDVRVKTDPRTGQPKWAQWMREAKKIVKAAADEAEKPSRANVPAAANSGAALGSPEAIRRAYARGEIEWSKQVEAALAAL